MVVDPLRVSGVEEREGLVATPEVDGQVRRQDRVFQDPDHPFEFILG